MGATRVVHSACRFCRAECGLLVHVRGDRIEHIEGDPAHPTSRGRLCLKAQAIPELVEDPDRLRTPLRRVGARGAGRWQAIGWPEALDEIADRLGTLRDRHGPETLAAYRGIANSNVPQTPYFMRLLNAFGTPNLGSAFSVCVGPKAISAMHTYGRNLWPLGDYQRARAILLFGSNPAASFMHRYGHVMEDLHQARARGAWLVVVDPRRTETTREASLHLALRPGTDGALALGLLHVILREDLLDRDFVGRHAVGLDHLAAAAAPYTPERVERITWIPARTVEEVARRFAGTRPACADRRQGVLHQSNATQTCRAIDALNVVTGNVDAPGGLIFTPPVPVRDITLREALPAERQGVSRFRWSDGAVTLPETILSGRPYPIRAFIAFSGNPLLSFPNAALVRQAFHALDLVVVLDLYLTETAQLADFVLPVTSFMERMDLNDSLRIPLAPLSYLHLRQPAVGPRHEAWPEWRIITELARRLGLGVAFPFDDVEALIDHVLEPTGWTARRLREERPSGVVHAEAAPGGFLARGFPTPSGKIELHAPALAAAGAAPTATWEEPAESPASRPDLARDYPLILTTGARLEVASGTWTHNLPLLRKRLTENWVEIHPETARRLGIEDGARVAVESPRGRIELPARVSEVVPPAVVAIPFGWGHTGHGALARATPGANPNVLTDHAQLDPLGATPAYRAGLCRVVPVAGGRPSA
jgi:anaerobic selenocysteine-containing dehydrogenase